MILRRLNARQTQYLNPDVPDRDYAEFVINTARRTVKRENSLVRQIFYTAMSKDTTDPGNLGIVAPTSEGKTYPVIEVTEVLS